MFLIRGFRFKVVIDKRHMYEVSDKYINNDLSEGGWEPRYRYKEPYALVLGLTR